jgi:hypothetical protein
MRDLRKVDVKSAVFSVPHSKGVVRKPDNLHASTPLRRALSGAAGLCRIYIAQRRGAVGACAPNIAAPAETRALADRHGNTCGLPRQAGGRSRAIGRIGYHRNAGGRVARLPIHP